jgi:hypothetical protein
MPDTNGFRIRIKSDNPAALWIGLRILRSEAVKGASSRSGDVTCDSDHIWKIVGRSWQIGKMCILQKYDEICWKKVN